MIKSIEIGLVAKWKHDTPFENWLGRRADTSSFFKRLYLLYYRLVDKQYHLKGIEMARRVLRKANLPIIQEGRVTEQEILNDMIYALHRFGHCFEEYIQYELYNCNAIGKDEYVSDKMRYEYVCRANAQAGIALLCDKGRTYNKFKPFFKRVAVPVYSSEDKAEFTSFLNKYTEFIYKPLRSACGNGIKRVTVTSDNRDALFDTFLSEGPFIVEELIVQSAAMAHVHPASINTARIATVLSHGEAYILFAVLRAGRGNSVVDNAGSGGVFASVDKETGAVNSEAYTKDGGRLTYHPDTNALIPGTVLPEWDSVIALAKDLARHLPDMAYVSWDFAHTDNGWVLVEANAFGQFYMHQVPARKGVHRELLELLKEV